MEFHITVGAPGCGKSTQAQALLSAGDVDVIVSSDAIRIRRIAERNIPGDDPDFVPEVEPQVWQEVRETLTATLRYGYTPLLDCTNTDPIRRGEWLRLAEQFGATPIAHLFQVPYDECLRRNRERSRFVPEDVIERFWNEMGRNGRPLALSSEGWIVKTYSPTTTGGWEVQ